MRECRRFGGADVASWQNRDAFLLGPPLPCSPTNEVIAATGNDDEDDDEDGIEFDEIEREVLR